MFSIATPRMYFVIDDYYYKFVAYFIENAQYAARK